MTKQDQINQILEAIELVEQARELVIDALLNEEDEDMGKLRYYKSYGEFGFQQLTGNGNPYDDSLHNLVEELETELN